MSTCYVFAPSLMCKRILIFVYLCPIVSEHNHVLKRTNTCEFCELFNLVLVVMFIGPDKTWPLGCMVVCLTVISRDTMYRKDRFVHKYIYVIMYGTSNTY